MIKIAILTFLLYACSPPSHTIMNQTNSDVLLVVDIAADKITYANEARVNLGRTQYAYLFASNGDLILVSTVSGVMGFSIESRNHSWLDSNQNFMQWNGALLITERPLQMNHEPVLR